MMCMKIRWLLLVIMCGVVAGCTSTNDLAIEEAIQILDVVQADQIFVQKDNLPLRNAYIVVKDKRNAYVTINMKIDKNKEEACTYYLAKDINDMWQVDSVGWTSNIQTTPSADTFLPESKKENKKGQ